ncbi:TetR/AcrR family transcriptional regulator [Bacillus sp. FSL K6-0046]|uniref:TetR/AcrR family transcriptional regulator n=1 Tax=Bacillus sp. BS1807G30 TaxID=3153756 RepID=A0AAU7FHS2_9BACI|nr:TetR/AcrR family transcriptional regulator [Bacillus altitudinis]MCY7532136.1 TetR/AcrR family transcriptional regulator [Bacillus altitudinis]MDI6646151.1 TetR/AcrR family transcriptional regulator [Bacillus altitudinis]MDI6660820.1 TetR/AcrR family transcriptional regulator [Bacillus altitudinis]
MKKKEKMIIEAGMKLFASKGYNTTSVQEIADECHMSKGAFYLYFKSKEALLISILHYYYDKVFTRIHEVQTEGGTPKEAYRKQLTVYYDNILQQKDFIKMQLSDRALPLNEETQQLAKQIRLATIQLHIDNMKQMYGDAAIPYMADLCLTIEGMSHVYFELAILYDFQLEAEELASTMIHRIDDLMGGMMKRNDHPLISVDQASDWFGPIYERSFDPLTESLLKELRELAEAHYEVKDEPDLFEALGILENELNKQKPRQVIVKGMLYQLKLYTPLQPVSGSLLRILKEDHL